MYILSGLDASALNDTVNAVNVSDIILIRSLFLTFADVLIKMNSNIEKI